MTRNQSKNLGGGGGRVESRKRKTEHLDFSHFSFAVLFGKRGISHRLQGVGGQCSQPAALLPGRAVRLGARLADGAHGLDEWSACPHHGAGGSGTLRRSALLLGGLLRKQGNPRTPDRLDRRQARRRTPARHSAPRVFLRPFFSRAGLWRFFWRAVRRAGNCVAQGRA